MGDQRSERPLIRVAPGEVMSGGDEVELVAVVAVAGGKGEEQNDDGRRDRDDRPAQRGGLLCSLPAFSRCWSDSPSVSTPPARAGVEIVRILSPWFSVGSFHLCAKKRGLNESVPFHAKRRFSSKAAVRS
jgi:hypothetical protein